MSFLTYVTGSTKTSLLGINKLVVLGIQEYVIFWYHVHWHTDIKR